MNASEARQLPLQGLKVLELGQLIAGPFATKLLGEFGADVIKIEPPGTGDPLRKWRMIEDGTSLWWHVQTRNKRSVALDLRSEEGQGLVRQLAAEADVVVENFRPGTLDNWGLGWEALSQLNPRLIMVHISGYGQTGPYRDKPGFGVIGEAMGGLRYLTGQPGEPSVRVGVSIGDSLSALYAVIGTLLALQERNRSGLGQEIDVALYESVFAMMESLLPEFDASGQVREPSGSALPGITPSNAYRCQGGDYVLIAGNGDSIFKRLMGVIGRDDLANDPALAHNDGRSQQAEAIDAAIQAWTADRPRDAILQALDDARVPAGYPYTAEDIAFDPHYLAREMIQTFTRPNGKPLKVPGVLPKLSATPGRLGDGGPTLGQHTDDVLDELGIDHETRAKLRQAGII
ncbi:MULTISPECIES: CaiB/BaiF CoA transferase family protein [Halomonadaceae]|jgi:crotonobetainyl-CoA:carnitine CoA-transferase CaiB-like acyl-CoA transferase|uniref:CaiB/BaiF CoA transferase family protein n=1 Tax=Halomonadaceae TaxID=28256 RepID=UPI0012F1B6E5|nr:MULTISPECIES: CoA transferase [Halomonas]CAD5257754.1 Succinyl-CoA--D-citramalate CoA-transferase [Halomonas sp. 59]CAD5257960.1 Succinyl-CoA--D-citramalate CoA-transferase [Halomonas sp. 113]CAD5271840.1 Succinyl-CoA--D-citramalate CoA-transferase [Halomonas sp. I3]CAD5290790.1 Succinyl-CoA--D-citramalate CoA-transferase [Halomonas sp. 156]VXB26637.1 Succinyl-CoA--D-citramalate CoA-transferase [Halomonas titanicae]